MKNVTGYIKWTAASMLAITMVLAWAIQTPAYAASTPKKVRKVYVA